MREEIGHLEGIEEHAASFEFAERDHRGLSAVWAVYPRGSATVHLQIRNRCRMHWHHRHSQERQRNQPAVPAFLDQGHCWSKARGLWGQAMGA